MAGKDSAIIEVELRLTGAPEDLQAVFDSPLMVPDDGREDEVADLESRYFDTSDQRLRAKGLALRVRAAGDGFWQTLKADDDVGGAVLQRAEWTNVLDDGQLDLERLPKDARRLLMKAAGKEDLTPIFRTRVQRRSRELTIDNPGMPACRIEAALDLGAIDSDTGSLPLAEIELELVEGQPQSLYRLALDMQQAGQLRLETCSKSSRAFDHVLDQPPAWHRATDPPLASATTVDEAMAAIFESCFGQWLANQAAAIDGRDPEGVHQMRVGLRRLRSALSMFRKLIPADQLAWLRPGAREAIGVLGPARDWDVFQHDLLAPVLAARPGDADLDALRTRAKARGRSGHRAARKAMESADYNRFALRFGSWLHERAWRSASDARQTERLAKPITDFARSLLEKRHKHVLLRGSGFEGLSIEQRHDARLALKKFRYAAEFFHPLFAKKTVKPFVASLRALQDDLGLLNDVAVAETLLQELLARPGKQDLRHAAGLVIGWHAHGVAAVEPTLLRDWNSFATQKAFWR